MSPSDFLDRSRFEVITEQLMLADKVNPDDKMPVVVKVYRDKKTQRAYQVDFRNGEYREARHVIEQYGEWKKLSPPK